MAKHNEGPPCSHRNVALMSANITQRSPRASVLVENGTCRDCGDAVHRSTLIKGPSAWVSADSAPTPTSDAPLYLCVVHPRRKAG